MLKALLPFTAKASGFRQQARTRCAAAFLMNLALAGIATAQINLVPNPGFEDTTYCSGWPPPQLEATSWYTANTATPDIWNCNVADPCGYHIMDPDDPSIQLQGYKYAYEGERFFGGYQWYGPGNSNARDYVTAKLLQPLEAGVAYKVSLFCAKPSGVNGAINAIGVYFGPDSVHAPFPTTLPFVPQAHLRSSTSAYIEDTDWQELADTIEAAGNEEWITVGTFADGDDVDGIWLGWGSYPPAVYYYMDLISVVAVTSQTVAPLNPDEHLLSVQGPDIVWSGGFNLDRLIVTDAAGRTVWVAGGSEGSKRFPIPSRLSAGAYIAIASTTNAQYVARFVK
ncbi:MAG: hypothetical protein IPL81_04230 [Flavobacteriales bacterium]|nr:hypothetical protein [Flavobacteriales bacterium]MBK6893627.1 hypothetical protein [Flavobacteriales bacterium]MBK7248661.1 hypothetical protein [Flavobacteriales bacterium]MBK9059107.1 hypothetical protein [Flavobacteriales bacterium]HQV38858.1 hypothetical protein [Flavobacteriales bacterium]